MARTWQQDAEDVWTLRGDEGDILLAVTRRSSGEGEPVFHISGGPVEEAQDFSTFDEARNAADRMIDEVDS